MKISITYWLALSYLFLSFLTKAQINYHHLADSLFSEKKMEEAATQYERVFLFSNNTNEKIDVLFKRAKCFKIANQNYKAYNSLVRVLQYDLSDSLKCKANYELALNLYLSNYFLDAEKYCAKNYSLPINTNDYSNSILLHTFILNELNNYSMASAKSIDYISNLTISKAKKDSLLTLVSSYYIKKNVPKLKSLKKARRLSKILPGAGLFYAGKPGKALANIGFQLLAVGYTGLNVYAQNYVTAATAGIFFVRMFYTGGVNQLNEVIPKVNYSKTRKFNDTFKTDFILKLKQYEAI